MSSVKWILTIAALAGAMGVLSVTRAETGLVVLTLTRVIPFIILLTPFV